MPTDIKVPTLGESVTTATISRWLKRVGDSVAADEPLVELETDKVTVEVNAPLAGVLGPLAAAEGAEVEVGALLGTIQAGDFLPSALIQAAPSASLRKDGKSISVETAGPQPQPTEMTHSPLPSATKLMRENGLSSSQVGYGTGKNGRITKGDVLEIVKTHAPPPLTRTPEHPRATQDGEERVKMTRLRRTIAARLKEAQNTAAILTTFNEVDMSAAMALKAEYRDLFEKRHGGVRLGFMGLFVRACVTALQEYPAVNAEIDGDEIVYKHFVHMGIAVGGSSGLVVPVIRHAERLTLVQIEKAVSGYGRAARDGTLKIDDLAGGTFSITNGGVYGSLMSTPIINPPQSAILGMHKVQDRPVVVAGKIEIRPMMYLALSYDHRIVDGKEAVSFLVKVKESVEDPRRLVLGL